jgi:hypothetical protein
LKKNQKLKKARKAERAKKSENSKKSSKSEVAPPTETPVPTEKIPGDELSEEEDEYDELVHDITSWLDHFDDISLPELPKFNFIVFITCLIGQLLAGFPCSLGKQIANSLPQAVIEEP